MTTPAPVPHWPGRLVAIAPGERVWVATTPQDAGRRERELVLCVHGMSGAATNWTDLMAELAPDFDCVALDLPGSGFSPPPRSGAGYSVSALARTVIRLIETLTTEPDSGQAVRGGRVHLIGNSMGGAVAVRVAARRPDLVQTLTLISPALPDLRLRRSAAHFPVLALPFLGEWIVRKWSGHFPVRDRVAGVFAACFYDPSCIHPDRFELEVEALRRRDGLSHEATALARAARALVAETLTPHPFSLWDAAQRVTAHSLVLYGSHDRLVSPRFAARAARVFRNARVVVLPQTGHIAQMECPRAVAALFREMVDATRDAGNSGRRDPVGA